MTNAIRIHLLETKYEFLKLLRLPAYAVPTLLFPVVFYLFFGVGMGRQSVHGVTMATYLVVSYGAFGVIGASLFGFGVTVATERGQGWLQVKRTTPMPVTAYFFSKIVMAMTFSAVIVLLLFATGTLLGGVKLTLLQGLALFGTLVAGAIPFSALGLAIGYFAGPNSAAPIVNIIYLPMSFLSGLWIPIWALPKFLQALAFFLPPYHFSQLAFRIIGAGRGGSVALHLTALVISTALFLALAYVGYRKDEGKSYG
jgi:ABC-2 type transport system permease protein